jgi:hypothetical protein
MELEQVKTIDEIILLLENIVVKSIEHNNPAGYFAALYQKVTIHVKEGIASGFFDDGPQMEQLDVAFAKRFLQAFDDYQKNKLVTEVWKKTFDLSDKYWPIVLQHLLMGMNAHINLDLGIAAAETSKGQELKKIENDFNKINKILSILVHEVEDDLSVVWPALKFILKWTGKIDDYLVDFSMKLARDGAWKFACNLALLPENEIETSIAERDHKIANKVNIILKPGLIPILALRIIRITERGKISDKIQKLRIPNTISKQPDF